MPAVKVSSGGTPRRTTMYASPLRRAHRLRPTMPPLGRGSTPTAALSATSPAFRVSFGAKRLRAIPFALPRQREPRPRPTTRRRQIGERLSKKGGRVGVGRAVGAQRLDEAQEVSRADSIGRIESPVNGRGRAERGWMRARAGQFEKVLQALTCPLLSPVVSHCWRIADEPWVKLSGTA